MALSGGAQNAGRPLRNYARLRKTMSRVVGRWRCRQPIRAPNPAFFRLGSASRDEIRADSVAFRPGAGKPVILMRPEQHHFPASPSSYQDDAASSRQSKAPLECALTSEPARHPSLQSS